MRPTKEEIETFVRESGAIAEEGFDLEDDVVKRHLEMAQIVAKSHRVGQVELVNATLCGIKDGWFRNSVSTGNMDRVPLVAHIPALHTQWRVFVDKGIECHISKPDEEKELFAWQVHDELLCMRLFKHKNGETARLMLNDCRQRLGLAWKLLLYKHSHSYFDRVDAYRTDIFLPKYRRWVETKQT